MRYLDVSVYSDGYRQGSEFIKKKFENTPRKNPEYAFEYAWITVENAKTYTNNCRISKNILWVFFKLIIKLTILLNVERIT